MSFASPLWLLGLVPWAGVAAWLLLGRRRRVTVPFIPIWRGATQSARPRPALLVPPWPVLLILFSLFLGVLASAHPLHRSRAALPVTIIVDRGITMSARGVRLERFKETSDRVAAALLKTIGDGPVRLIWLPTGQERSSTRASWAAVVAGISPSIQKSSELLDEGVRHALAENQDDVIVITDQPTIDDPRVLRFEPDRVASNLAVVNVAARALPRAQVMIELRDQNCLTSVRPVQVRVQSDGHEATQSAQVPRNGSMTMFVDLPSLGPVISIDAQADDDLSADNQAWLARESNGAEIEDSPSLPDTLQRLIAVYRRNRGTGGKPVEFVQNSVDAPADRASLVLPRDVNPVPQKGDLQVEDHPVTSNVNWHASIQNGRGGLAPAGYKPIVAAGECAFVAIRDQPLRSVWIGLNSPEWPKTADYVIFWTNVFDWLGGDTGYRWHPVADQAKAGISNDDDGLPHAYNVGAVDFPSVQPNDWGRLNELDGRTTASTDLTPATCLIALALMAFAISKLSV